MRRQKRKRPVADVVDNEVETVVRYQRGEISLEKATGAIADLIALADEQPWYCMPEWKPPLSGYRPLGVILKDRLETIKRQVFDPLKAQGYSARALRHVAADPDLHLKPRDIAELLGTGRKVGRPRKVVK